VWTSVKNLASTGIRSPDRPARRQSLYRLRYPAHRFIVEVRKNVVLPSSRPKYSVPVNTKLTGMRMCFDYTGRLQGMTRSINNGRGKKIDPKLQRHYQNGIDSFKNRDNCSMFFCSICVNLHQCTVSSFRKL